MRMQEFWEKFNKDEKLVDFIFYLRDRWVEEGEYESIDEYLKAIQKSIPEAYKVYKKPFGFKVKCTDGDVKVSVKVRGTKYALNGEFFKGETPMDRLDKACRNLVDRTSVNEGDIELYEEGGIIYIKMNGANIDVFNSKDKQLKARVSDILLVLEDIERPVRKIMMPLDSNLFDSWIYLESTFEGGSIDLVNLGVGLSKKYY